MILFCNLFGLHYFTPYGVKVGFTSEIKINRFIMYFARFALPLDKVGCTSTIQNEKTHVFSLNCLRFALPLHKLNIIAYANQ